MLLKGLNDLVQDEQLLDKALDEDVTKTSLLRNVSLSSIKRQFKRLLEGGARLTDYDFKYKIKQGPRTAGMELDFHVIAESNPPTNIHVLIGRNGVGKTHLFNNMVKSLVDTKESVASTGEFSDMSDNLLNQDGEDLFAGIVSVAFSAFDPFEPYTEKKDKSEGVRYSYVGLKRSTNRGGDRGTPMSHDMLTNEFVNSLMACFALGKADRWKNALQTLESDPLFKEAELGKLSSLNGTDELDKAARSLYKRMSSGHGIVLLTMTKLIEKVEERTLVLIDEPEGHLHPPLLSAFVRALSDLLTHRNGVAIIATHSPVVVQEVPKSCVWKLRRTGLQAHAERPEIETFGENVGILTREIFGLEVTDSGYHQLLKKALVRGGYERILKKFDNQLGSEARSIVRGLVADQDTDGDQ